MARRWPQRWRIGRVLVAGRLSGNRLTRLSAGGRLLCHTRPEHPLPIARRRLEPLLRGGKARLLDRSAFRQAIHRNDAALAVAHQPPFRPAGDGVGVEPAQMAHRHGETPVLEQVLQAGGIGLLGPRPAPPVGLDGAPVLFADEQQLRLLLPLGGGGPHRAHGRHARPECGQDEEQGEQHPTTVAPTRGQVAVESDAVHHSE
jgi:hypothetical protein